jgi:hypothetical protein
MLFLNSPHRGYGQYVAAGEEPRYCGEEMRVRFNDLAKQTRSEPQGVNVMLGYCLRDAFEVERTHRGEYEACAV